jgi:chromosome partitioning protein
MKIIGVFNQKGGVGKSTLATHGGVVASWHIETLIVDADPQRTVADWHETRLGELGFTAPDVIEVEAPDFRRRLREYGGDPGVVIVDMAPGVYANASEILKMCDFVVVPSSTTMPDLRSTDGAAKLLAAHGVPFAFVLNQTRAQSPARTEEAKDYLKPLVEEYGALVCPHTIERAFAFADALVEGKAISEFAPGTAAVDQIVDVWNWIFQQVGRVPVEVTA